MKIFSNFIIAVVLVTLVNVAHAEDKLIFSAYSKAPPNFWVKDGKLTGVGPEMVETIFTELGLSVESKIYPWKRILMLSERGDIDVIVGLYVTKERAEYLEYFKPHYTTVQSNVIVAKGKVIPFKKWEDLIGFKGGSLMGDSFGEEFDTFMAENLNIEEVGTVEQGIKMLIQGRIDFMPMSRRMAEIQSRKFGLRDDIEILDTPIKTEKLYMAISKKSPFLKYLPEVNKKLEELTGQGYIEKLFQKYYKILSSEDGKP